MQITIGTWVFPLIMTILAFVFAFVVIKPKRNVDTWEFWAFVYVTSISWFLWFAFS